MLRRKILVFLLLVALLMSFYQLTKTVRSSSTTLKITPERNIFAANITAPGSKFIINVTVTDVTDLFAWQIGLAYNNSLINFTKIILPSDHVFAGKSFLETPVVTEPGVVYYGITLGPGQTSVNVASGTLCQLEFEILDPSITGVTLPALCTLHFIDSDYTFLLNHIGAVIESTWQESIFAYSYLRASTVTVDGQEFNLFTCSTGEMVPGSLEVLTAEKAIKFNLTGTSGFGFVNITIPKALLNGNPSAWTVYVNDATTPAQITWNATHTFVYVEFNFGSQVAIKIKGTWIVPEFVNMSLLAIFLTGMAATTVLVKTKKAKN